MVSVIIPTFNEKKILEECIESLGSQTYNDFEIIVVDDGSTDTTWQLLSEIRNSKFEIRKLRAKHGGPGAARNLGAARAKGNILVFVDADMTFDSKFIAKLVEPIEKGTVKGTFSKEEFVSNRENIWAKCWNINENWEPGRRHPKNYPDRQPVFRAILRKEFKRVGGFTPGGYDDDWTLYKKLGYEAVNAPGAVFYHANPSSLSEVYLHARWVGKRKYKFEAVGFAIALIRASFPISLIVGIYKSILSGFLPFLPFKIVYDFGIFTGILGFLTTGKAVK